METASIYVIEVRVVLPVLPPAPFFLPVKTDLFAPLARWGQAVGFCNAPREDELN